MTLVRRGPAPGGRGHLLLGLNIRAGGGARAAALLAYLERRRPHLVVLSEWRDNAAGGAFADWARRRRMHGVGLADGGTANGVFIAAREPFDVEPMTPGSGSAGVIAFARFAGFRLLACYFPLLAAKAAFFARCAEIAARHAAAPLLLLGDLNTGNQERDREPAGVRYACADAFDALTSGGLPHDLWRRSQGAKARQWSWLSHRGRGFRIDHALANDPFVAWADPHCRYDHRPRRDRLTDHSALLVTISPATAGRAAMAQRVEPQGRGQGLAWPAHGIELGDQRRERARCRDPGEGGPELGLERDAGAVAGQSEAALDQAGRHHSAARAAEPIMSSGRTQRSNSSALTWPSRTAASFSVMFSESASLPIATALS